MACWRVTIERADGSRFEPTIGAADPEAARARALELAEMLERDQTEPLAARTMRALLRLPRPRGQAPRHLRVAAVACLHHDHTRRRTRSRA